jgi:hypothetical protein
MNEETMNEELELRECEDCGEEYPADAPVLDEWEIDYCPACREKNFLCEKCEQVRAEYDRHVELQTMCEDCGHDEELAEAASELPMLVDTLTAAGDIEAIRDATDALWALMHPSATSAG